MRLSQIARDMQVELRGVDAEIRAVSTDSRTPGADTLFVALKGPNFDGHDYLEQARLAGAVAAMVSREAANGLSEVRLPLLLVEDTRIALGQLAALWRGRFSIPVVAVTGSNGKTSVKEMVAAILAQRGEVLATRGNLNNDIGVPLTLFGLDAHHHAAVIEMGANHPGEIAYLTQIARPSVALITNAGSAHLEGFGSLEGVARSKGEIYQGLAEDGVAVINADDRFAPLWDELCADHATRHFGLERPAEFRASAIEQRVIQGRLVTCFELHTPDGSIAVELALLGRHNVINALAAAAAAMSAGAGLDEVASGLGVMHPVAGRLNPIRGIKGARLIDDSYNANPSSLAVGVEVVTSLPGEAWLALGDMGELGDGARTLHASAGEGARKAGIARLFTLGELSRAATQAFGEGAQHFDDLEALVTTLRSELHEGINLLIKGSRTSRMERLVSQLRDDASENNNNRKGEADAAATG